MNEALNRSVYEQIPTVAQAYPTLYDPMFHLQEQSQPQPQPEKPAPEAAKAPADKWEAIQLFADRVNAVLEVERELSLVLERRQTLGRRVVDAAKRRDEELAAESTQAWIRTEVQMHAVAKKSEPAAAERESTLRALGLAG